MLIGVVWLAIISAEGVGIVKVSKMKAIDINICMVIVHQRLVLMISTNGLQKGLNDHGRYNKLVNKAISPFGTPIFVNIITEMLFTMKYGIP
jgi:hypothetical protein